jgi:creatinine amidohydrolase
MKRALVVIFLVAVSYAQSGKARGILLENLTWQEAEHVLTPDRVVVIALGAQSKEHGPHLRLNNDWLMAEYFKGRVVKASDVIIARPSITASIPLSWNTLGQPRYSSGQRAT